MSELADERKSEFTNGLMTNSPITLSKIKSMILLLANNLIR